MCRVHGNGLIYPVQREHGSSQHDRTQLVVARLVDVPGIARWFDGKVSLNATFDIGNVDLFNVASYYTDSHTVGNRIRSVSHASFLIGPECLHGILISFALVYHLEGVLIRQPIFKSFSFIFRTLQDFDGGFASIEFECHLQFQTRTGRAGHDERRILSSKSFPRFDRHIRFVERVHPKDRNPVDHMSQFMCNRSPRRISGQSLRPSDGGNWKLVRESW